MGFEIKIRTHQGPTQANLESHVSRLNYLMKIIVDQFNDLRQRQRERFWQAPAIQDMYEPAFRPFVQACYLRAPDDVNTIEEAKAAILAGTAFPYVQSRDMWELNWALTKNKYAAYDDAFVTLLAQRVLYDKANR